MAFEAGSIVARIKADVTNFKQGMAEAQHHTSKFTDFMGSAVKGSAIFAAGLATVGIGAAIAGKKILDASGNLESMKQGFVTLLGSTEKANDAIAMIKRDAAATPFEVKGLIQANQLLTSVTKDAGRSETFLLNIGKALSAMGKGQAELDRVIVNLQQIGAVGKASMMDLRQFAFAGIPIFDMLKEKTGLTGDALENFVADGKVSFELLESIFNEAGSAGGKFFDAFKNQQGTWNQLWSNLVDTFDVAMDDILRESGAFDIAKQALAGLINWLGDHKDEIVAFFKGGFEWIKDNWPIIVSAIVAGLIPAIIALGTAIATNPITWIVAAVIALGLAIKAVIDHFGGWNAVMERMRPVIEFFQLAWNTIVTLFNERIRPALERLWQTFQEKLLPKLQEFWEKHGPAIMQALGIIAAFVGGVLLVSIYAFIYAIEFLINVFTWVVDAVSWMVDMWNKRWDEAKAGLEFNIKLVTDIINGFISFFQHFPENIGFIIGSVVRWFMELPTNAQNMANGIMNWINQLPGRAWGAFMNMFNAIMGWLNALPGQAQNAAANMVNGFIGWINSLPGRVWGIMAGVANTIGGFAGWLWEQGRRIAASVWEGFKRGLGIHSPSYIEKAFMAIGKQSEETLSQMTKDVGMLNGLASTLPTGDLSLSGAGNSNVDTKIFGNINIGSEVDADNFLARLAKNQELANKGMVTNG